MPNYQTSDEVRTYATARGVSIPNDDTDIDVQVQVATDYIDALEDRYIGRRSNADQDNAFPRSGLTINGYTASSTEVPPLVLELHSELVIDQRNGVDIWNRDWRSPTQSAKGGSASVVFAAKQQHAERVYTRAMILLQRLTRSSFGATNIPARGL